MLKQQSGSRLVGLCAAAGVGVVLLAGSSARAQLTTFSATGPDPTSITATRDAFRTAIGGGTVAGANGSFGGLRREINWDAVPAGFSDPNPLPGTFFNVNSPRGAVFSTPGTGFMVSANAGGATPTLFGFSGDFQTFSPQKLFTAVNSNITDVTFFLPGSGTPSSVTAFGAIFTDVETANTTSIAFFDVNNNQIGSTLFSDLTGNQGLSFIGATSTVPILRVRITSGVNTIVSNGVLGNPTDDVVAMDDFIYSEPVAVASLAPEPGSFALLGSVGLTLAGVFVRKRRS